MYLIIITGIIKNHNGLNDYIDLNKRKEENYIMATIFGNMLSALAKVFNNGVSTFTLLGFFDETDCPNEIL